MICKKHNKEYNPFISSCPECHKEKERDDKNNCLGNWKEVFEKAKKEILESKSP